MNCESCNAELDKKWNYCPYCGFMVKENITLFDYLNQQIKHLTKRMEDEAINFEDLGLPKNITISIHTNLNKNNFGIDRIRKVEKTKEPKKMPDNTIEPEANVKNYNGLIIVTLNLPGVKSEDDIDINIFSNSVEIRAVTKDKGYFKIIKIPTNYTLVHREFENGELKLQFSE